jgi:hypothetical protein
LHGVLSMRTVVGERLSLDAVNSFYSFTENAFAVHEHDARTGKIGIFLSSPSFSVAWQAWSKALTDIAGDFRGNALLEKFHLTMARDYHLVDALDRLSRLVEHEKISRSQDTMLFGWAYLLSAIKTVEAESFCLPDNVNEEIRALRSNFSTALPFLSRAPKLRGYFETWSSETSALLLGRLGLRDMDYADFLAIATLKHYERYNIKSEGRGFNYKSFQDDVREIASMNKGAAAFLVYQLGSRLSDSIIASLQALPVSPSADGGKETSEDRAEVNAISKAEVPPHSDNGMAIETSPVASGSNPNRPLTTLHQATEQGARPPSSTNSQLVGHPQNQEHHQTNESIEQQELVAGSSSGNKQGRPRNNKAPMQQARLPLGPEGAEPQPNSKKRAVGSRSKSSA